MGMKTLKPAPAKSAAAGAERSRRLGCASRVMRQGALAVAMGLLVPALSGRAAVPLTRNLLAAVRGLPRAVRNWNNAPRRWKAALEFSVRTQVAGSNGLSDREHGKQYNWEGVQYVDGEKKAVFFAGRGIFYYCAAHSGSSLTVVATNRFPGCVFTVVGEKAIAKKTLAGLRGRGMAKGVNFPNMGRWLAERPQLTWPKITPGQEADLLSGCTALGATYSPFRVRLAFVSGAKEEHFTFDLTSSAAGRGAPAIQAVSSWVAVTKNGSFRTKSMSVKLGKLAYRLPIHLSAKGLEKLGFKVIPLSSGVRLPEEKPLTPAERARVRALRERFETWAGVRPATKFSSGKKPEAANGKGPRNFVRETLRGEGRGAAPSRIKSTERYRKAAAEGSTAAMDDMGMAYLEGRGVTHDYTRAMKWFRRAAVQGEATAMRNIGILYAKGLGVRQDYTKAMTWFRRAAAQGDATAMLNIGVLYANGLGLGRKHYAKAMAWYRRAAAKGNATAMFNIGVLYASGLGLGRKDYAKAMVWFRRAAAKGNARAMFSIGILYAKGLGLRQDYTKAMAWFRRAAAKGNDRAVFSIGWCYYRGWGVRQNYTKAMAWFRKAAVRGDAKAILKIGLFYYRGWGVRQNYTKAMAWFRKAAVRGNAKAMFNIGLFYYQGWGVRQDYTKAMAWFRKAAAKGNATAMCDIGGLYCYGRGVPRNDAKAMKWFVRAAKWGNPAVAKLARHDIATLIASGG